MDHYLDHTVHITVRDADSWGICRPSSLLYYMQETAILHAYELGVGREETLAQYNCFWMLVRIWYRLERPVRWQDDLTIRTWHRGPKGATIYRDFDLLVNGKRVGEAVSLWVLADIDTRRILRMSRLSQLQSSSGGSLCKERTLKPLHPPEKLETVERRTMRYSETDVNGHINNTHYASFACDALHCEDGEKGDWVREMEITFHAECRAGEDILLSVGQADGKWAVHGAGLDQTSRFDILVTFGREAS